MEEPSQRKYNEGRRCQAGHCSPLPNLEVNGVVEDLQHKVFPIDVDPVPQVGEAGGKKVKMVGLRQVEAEEMQHADNDVKLTRYPDIETEIGYQVAHQLACVRHF